MAMVICVSTAWPFAHADGYSSTRIKKMLEICNEAKQKFSGTTTVENRIKQRKWLVNCYQQIVDTERALDSTNTSDEIERSAQTRTYTKRIAASTPATGHLAVNRQLLTKDENERDFKDASFSLGTAILREPTADGSNDTVHVVGLHKMRWTWHNETAGVGPFVAINMDAPKKGINYVGVGAVFSFRIDGAGYPFSFGAGYLLDRKGYLDMETMKRGDRSGMFIMVSTNPAPPVVKTWQSLFPPK